MPSPTPRSKFLFMHVVDPKKAPVTGAGRRGSEIGRMLRRAPGQEDLGGEEAEELGLAAGRGNGIDPKLRSILGLGAGAGLTPVGEEDDEEEGEEDEEEDEEEEISRSSSSSSSSGGRRGRGGGAGSSGSSASTAGSGSSGAKGGLRRGERRGRRGRRGSSWLLSPSLNPPPMGGVPLRNPLGGDPAGGLSALFRAAAGGEAGDDRAEGAEGGMITQALNARILEAARRMQGVGAGGKGGEGSESGSAGAAASAERREVLDALSYAERRAALRRERERKINRRMMERVHQGTMPPELILDDDLARSSRMDVDNFEDDPDAYETEELLGSDVESIPSTDEERDTAEIARRRERLRDKRRRLKVRVLRRRRREAWATKRRDIETAKSRYYDDMIDQLVMDNPALNPPHASADLETKRAFVDRATAESLTRSKIDQMTRWIRVVSVVVENLGVMTGFLMLDGLSLAVDQELRKPELQPVIAQMARKYLRRGPSSPEWALAIMCLGCAGTVHAANVRQQEITASASGKGTASGPGASKLGKVITGGMKIARALGFVGGGGGGGGGGGAPAASGSAPAPDPALAAQTVAQRYVSAAPPPPPPPPQPAAKSAPRPRSRDYQQQQQQQPRPQSREEAQARDDDGDDSSAEDVRLDAAPWE